MTKDLNRKDRSLDHLVTVANHFKSQGRVTDIQEYGNGNINHTFLVTLDGETDKHFILQRINTRVFRRPELVMANMRTLTEHVRQRLQATPASPARTVVDSNGCKLSLPPGEGRGEEACRNGFPLNLTLSPEEGGKRTATAARAGHRWEVPRVLLTRDGRDHWIDPEGSFYRAISFIEAARSFDTIQNARHAHEVGIALGRFQSLLADLPIERLADTLEGFHITPRYLCHYDEVLAKCGVSHSSEADYGLQFVSARRTRASVLEQAKAQGRLRLRPIHGDPKVNNVMIDTVTRQAVGIVDLDTVKPGLVHYDIGDCLRSCCNPLGEETADWEAVRFEPDLCQAILAGYLSRARDFLTESDYEYLFDAIRLIAFELGLRFLTDYLEGNVYFKVSHAEHNLARALVQFKLTESIEAQEAAICAIIGDLR
jgi:Ser/Thr protein kinase RdoA (MazF antagonist)